MPLRSATFANTLAFARASKAWRFAVGGALTETANDTPRFDYDASNLPVGIMVEDAATNRIRNPRPIGAAVGAPGTTPNNWSSAQVAGVSREIVAIGTEDGLEYIDYRLFGTPTGTSANVVYFESTGQIVAATGQTWTMSAYLRMVAGSAANATFGLRAMEYDDVATLLAANTTIISAPTAAPLRSQRRFVVRSLIQAGTLRIRPGFVINVTTGLAIDVTIRIAYPQLEQTAWPTSIVLPPTGTTATSTRAGESLALAALPPNFNREGGAFYIEARAPPVVTGAERGLLLLHDGTAANQIDLRLTAAGALRLSSVAGGAAGASAILAATVTPDTTLRIAIAYDLAGVAGIVAGGAVVEGSGIVPIETIAAARLASIGGALPTDLAGSLGGTLRRLTYHPSRLANADLLALVG